jgi:hypothetical protein
MLLAVVAWLVAFLLGLFPIWHHVALGLSERRRSILGYFNDHAAQLYFQQFYPSEVNAPHYAEKLAELYDKRFGVRAFWRPLALYVIALAVTVTVVLATAFSALKVVTVPSAVVAPIPAYALAGAYLWIVSDMIQRYSQRDLVPGALYAAVFRIVIAIPTAYAIAAILNDTVAPTFAFLLGTFPTNTLFLIMRRTVSKRFGLGEEAEANRKHELETLQGVNTAIAEKLSDIGISTLLLLAYEDPIQLTMRTNLSFSFGIDIVSQALAGLYIDLAKARKYSVRGAQEAATLYYTLSHGPPASREKACATLDALAKDLGIQPAALDVILFEISKDPYTKFLREIWT